MNCKKAKEMSTEYLSDDLNDAEKAEFLGHLKACDYCDKEMSLLSKSWQTLSLYAPPELGDEFVDSLMAKIRAGRAKKQSWIFRFIPLGFSQNTRAALSGWWKVPALTLASCAIYLVCIETGFMPSRQFAPAAISASQDGAGTISSMLSDGQETGGGGHLLTIICEGADK